MSVSASFQTLIDRIQPTDMEVSNAKQHAEQIRTRLDKSYNLKKLLVAGSYSRKTYIHNSSDIDLFSVVSRDDVRWGGAYVSSSTMLENYRKELTARYPFSTIYRDVHAIVVEFFGGIRVDVVPAMFSGMTPSNWPLYKMPDGAGGWMNTSPDLHNFYIKQADEKAGGKLRRTAQLIKFWRECRTPRVPLSSFHIEMLLAAEGICDGVRSYAECVTVTLQVLAQRDCQALRDPLGIAGNIPATRSSVQRDAALRSIVYSRDHAKAALAASAYLKETEAKRQWDIVFNNQFPR